ncbi:MAG TPA: hypothetical protein VJR22_04325 [Candidatus Nitrosotalea sp.]|nr:hypothetical protein [Candidatus Nitrosotalea sp.]
MMKTQTDPQKYKESTGTVTFRLDSKVLAKLKTHAQYEKSTVNALVNKLLLQAIEWDVVAAKSSWVPIEDKVIKLILEKLDDKEIVQVAQKEGKTLPRDLCLSMRGNYGISEWIDMMKIKSFVAGFDLTAIHDENESVFVMRHDMGEKYSLHSKLFYEQAFKDLGCDATFQISENTLVIKIPKRYLSK